MKVQLNTQTSFTGNHAKRGARSIGQLMNKLYESAYKNELYGHSPDIIQISSKMKDGTDVSAVASFVRGKFIDLSFPYEWAHYRSEFCKKILYKYNTVLTKGKCNKFK